MRPTAECRASGFNEAPTPLDLREVSQSSVAKPTDGLWDCFVGAQAQSNSHPEALLADWAWQRSSREGVVSSSLGTGIVDGCSHRQTLLVSAATHCCTNSGSCHCGIPNSFGDTLCGTPVYDHSRIEANLLFQDPYSPLQNENEALYLLILAATGS